ncbi:hypothetical protein Tco_0728402 [Tanacetum coccineum]|uniref:Uncharacterized protein n=1 Tax=Tanacetum coccineum TaxID=301880 RepID=A0ABQ4YM52_9ASTR
MEIDDHLEVGNADDMHFDSSGQEGLSHDETLGIVSNHATFQNWVDEESGNEHDVVLVRFDEQCQTEQEVINHDMVNWHIHIRLEIVIVKIDEHIDNDDPMKTEYDAESSENKGNKNDEDVMVDEENEINEVEVDVHLFGNNHNFTTIGVSSQVHKQVMLRVDAYVLEGDDFYSEPGCEGYGSCGRRS